VICRALIVLALLASPSMIAGAEIELSLVLGYRSGDTSFLVEADAPFIACLVPPCVVAEARTPESEVPGLVLDVPIASGWMFEALLNQQEGSLRLATDLPVEAGPLAPESFDLTTLQVGVLRYWDRDGLVPFAVAGIGVARAETSAALLTSPFRVGEVGRRIGSREALSLSLGGGGRLPLDARWGLRFEARAYWTDLPAELGGELAQAEVSVGLSARL
jgi:hypothetical protein